MRRGTVRRRAVPMDRDRDGPPPRRREPPRVPVARAGIPECRRGAVLAGRGGAAGRGVAAAPRGGLRRKGVDLSLLGQNLLAPPVLFFAAGALAVAVRSDLEIPPPLPRLFSLYLLLAIGFRGGAELRHAGLSAEAIRALGAGLAMSVAVPLVAFSVLRRRVSAPDARAIAATYGSVSAVTFITATAFLDRLGIPYGG